MAETIQIPVPVHRALAHTIAPRAPWDGTENPSISSRGRALIDIEFMTLHPLKECVITSPVAHIGVLAFLFPTTLFHVHESNPRQAGQNKNINKITAPFSSEYAPRSPFALIFTTETDERQLVHWGKTKPTAVLFAFNRLPSHHLPGTLILPISAPPGSTALFLHYNAESKAGTTTPLSLTYNPQVLGEELTLFHLETAPTGWYNQTAERFVLAQAIRHKIAAEGTYCDEMVVACVTESLELLLPHD